MLRTILLIALLLVTLGAVGCAVGSEPLVAPVETVDESPSPETSEAQVPTDTPSADADSSEDTAAYPAPAYPDPVMPLHEPYPGIEEPNYLEATREALPTLEPVSAPEADKGHFVGQIMRESEIRPREPLAGWTLYLAEIPRSVSGELAPLATIIEEEAPAAVTDRQGQYAFTNIEPGYYALIIKHPLTLVPARDLESAQDIVVEINAGEITEVPLTVVTISD